MRKLNSTFIEKLNELEKIYFEKLKYILRKEFFNGRKTIPYSK